MLTKRTAIGIGVGSVIIAVGIAALIMEITGGPLEVHETFGVGEATKYTITGDDGSHHVMTITGEKFDLSLQSPGDGLQIPKTSHTKEVTLDWVHLQDGKTVINLQNTGNSELVVDATLEVSNDPILFAYHFVVITSGVIIIGFSLGFSFRKPKGF